MCERVVSGESAEMGTDDTCILPEETGSVRRRLLMREVLPLGIANQAKIALFREYEEVIPACSSTDCNFLPIRYPEINVAQTRLASVARRFSKRVLDLDL
jgi:hypothetical protein